MVDTTIMLRHKSPTAFITLFVSICLPVAVQGQSGKRPDLIRSLSSDANLIGLARFNGGPAPSKELRRLLDRQARWDDAGLRNPDRSGLELRMVKIDNGGAAGGAALSRYRVLAEGAPQDRVFVLDTWLIDDTFSVDPRDLYVNVQGLVMTHKPALEEEAIMRAPGDELEVEGSKVSGEPIRFVLASRDGQTLIYGTVVEHPIVSYDRGCRLEVRVAQPNATAALVTLSGFPADTKVPLVLESGGEDVSAVLDIKQDGHAAIAVLTTVPGKTEGTLKATAEGGNCLPSVTLPWRSAAHQAAKPAEK